MNKSFILTLDKYWIIFITHIFIDAHDIENIKVYCAVIRSGENRLSGVLPVNTTINQKCSFIKIKPTYLSDPYPK